MHNPFSLEENCGQQTRLYPNHKSASRDRNDPFFSPEPPADPSFRTSGYDLPTNSRHIYLRGHDPAKIFDISTEREPARISEASPTLAGADLSA